MMISPQPQPITSEQDLNDLLNAPEPVWLYKHSNTCGVSYSAHDEISKFLSEHPKQRVGMLVVQENRPLSSLISSRLKYVHQSPQLFLMDKGAVAWSATHWGITALAMENALKATNQD